MNVKQKVKNQKNGVNESSHSSSPSLQAIWTLGFSVAALPLLARAERIYGDLPQLTRATNSQGEMGATAPQYPRAIAPNWVVCYDLGKAIR